MFFLYDWFWKTITLQSLQSSSKSSSEMQNTLLACEYFFLQIFTSIMLLFVTSNMSFLNEINFKKEEKQKAYLCAESQMSFQSWNTSVSGAATLKWTKMKRFTQKRGTERWNLKLELEWVFSKTLSLLLWPTWLGHWTFLCSFTSFFHFLSTSWLKAGRPGLAYFNWKQQHQRMRTHLTLL